MMRRHLVRWFVLGAVLAVASTVRPGSARQRTPDVPYVPTPYEVVEEMLRMAKVTADDVVYDLGCGDGRIVITAAQKYGARGVGVDIDPRRIQESQANAAKAGVTDRVRFIEGDLFQVDIREATVVTLYLLPDVNLRLRPKLLRELRPGTRIVSHDYDMGDWEPDAVVKVPGPTYQHTLYYWVVPASVEGTWRWTLRTASGEQALTAHIRQQFQKVGGDVLQGDGSRFPITEGRVQGDRVSFQAVLDLGGTRVPVRFEGRVDGDTVQGRAQVLEGPMAGAQDWTARRVGTPGTTRTLRGRWGLDTGRVGGLYIECRRSEGSAGPVPRLTSGRQVAIFKVAFARVL